jgi:hypothetical protein
LKKTGDIQETASKKALLKPLNIYFLFFPGILREQLSVPPGPGADYCRMKINRGSRG